MARKTKFVTSVEAVEVPKEVKVETKAEPKIEVVFKKLEEPKPVDQKAVAKAKLKQTVVNIRELSEELGTKYPNIKKIKAALDENIQILTALFKVNEA